MSTLSAIFWFVVLPLIVVSIACTIDTWRHRAPAWRNTFIGGLVSLLAYGYVDVDMVEHHPHFPRIFYWLPGLALGWLAALLSLFTVWLHRKLTPEQTSPEEASKP
ncbi:hypothetical protein [Brevifollis gellanilyticus]|uniref:Uncharacterized protein n=1 Tax=Brevifollis gellanilyticus TaxID=748831 RepID=A0A512MFK7_9BACT|nr:hypothetical protein [Brevifollis gellanilyticus]GEP45131.1 hypothetical protein BGE01nite_44220 [Brevifollis gellanilyticus]